MKMTKIYRNLRVRLRKLSLVIFTLLSGKKFFMFTLILFSAQTVWVACSLAYPLPYDEAYHFGITNAYTTQLDPIIENQSKDLDRYRDLGNETSFLYHYLLSFPLRIAQQVFDSPAASVIILRFINISFVIAGLVVFKKLFEEVGMKRLHVNLAIFLLTMIPVFVYLASTINYDNLLFLTASLFMLYALRYLRSAKSDWHNLSLTLIFGLFASLVKFTFLPIFAVVTIAWFVYILGGGDLRKFTLSLQKSFKLQSVQFNASVLSFILILLALFSSIYLKNLVVYGTPQPSCLRTLGHERCVANSIIQRSDYVSSTRDERKPVLLADYINIWISTMLSDQSLVIYKSYRPESLPIIYTALYIGAAISIGAILITLREFKWKSKEMVFLLLIVSTVFASVFIKNLAGYYTNFIPLAIQPRYVFMALPIIIILGVRGVSKILEGKPILASFLLVIVVFALTQGGGALSYVMRSEDSWYWGNDKVISVNHTLKEVLRPVIREYPGKYGF